MKIYVTRHGQVLPQRYYDSDAMFPVGDQPLSELGREQALYLGKKLKSLGFGGVIYSSPYMRTMETAQIIAQFVDVPIYPAQFMREILKTHEAAKEFKGMDKKQMLSRYKNLIKNFSLEYPWWADGREDFKKDVCKRVSEGILNLDRDKNILLVGHGATVRAVYDHFNMPEDKDTPIWNCSLSVYDDVTGEAVCNDISFMPYKKVSSNIRLMCEEK